MGQHQRRIAWIFLPVLFLMALLAPINNAAAQDGSRIVYVSRTGTKYHYVKDCSGMRNPSSMTLDQAISSGKTPCSNCVHEGSESGSAAGGAGGTTSKPSTGDVPSKPVEKPIWPFVDVYSGTSHSADISWLYDSGVTRGWPHSDGQTEFRPYQNVTRQDMAAFLYRLAGSPEFEPSEADRAYFSDVYPSSDHSKEIYWRASVGISKGWTESNGGHTFRGMRNIKRCDMAAFLMRLAEYMGGDTRGKAINPFSDVSQGTPHRDEILWLYLQGVTEGWQMPNGSKQFRPYENVKRCDMAAFLHRLKTSVG